MRQDDDVPFLGERLPSSQGPRPILAKGPCPFLAPIPLPTAPSLAIPKCRGRGATLQGGFAGDAFSFWPTGSQASSLPGGLLPSRLSRARPTASPPSSHSGERNMSHVPTLMNTLSPMASQAEHRSPSRTHEYSANPSLSSGMWPPFFPWASLRLPRLASRQMEMALVRVRC